MADLGSRAKLKDVFPFSLHRKQYHRKSQKMPPSVEDHSALQRKLEDHGKTC